MVLNHYPVKGAPCHVPCYLLVLGILRFRRASGRWKTAAGGAARGIAGGGAEESLLRVGAHGAVPPQRVPALWRKRARGEGRNRHTDEVFGLFLPLVGTHRLSRWVALPFSGRRIIFSQILEQQFIYPPTLFTTVGGGGLDNLPGPRVRNACCGWSWSLAFGVFFAGGTADGQNPVREEAPGYTARSVDLGFWQIQNWPAQTSFHRCVLSQNQ